MPKFEESMKAESFSYCHDEIVVGDLVFCHGRSGDIFRVEDTIQDGRVRLSESVNGLSKGPEWAAVSELWLVRKTIWGKNHPEFQDGHGGRKHDDIVAAFVSDIVSLKTGRGGKITDEIIDEVRRMFDESLDTVKSKDRQEKSIWDAAGIILENLDECDDATYRNYLSQIVPDLNDVLVDWVAESDEEDICRWMKELVGAEDVNLDWDKETITYRKSE